MSISIIVAMAQNRAIGKDNKLLWHISEDLKHFKSITIGHTIVMGRKTYESIGRPLPNRRNIVVSRNNNYKAEGCDVVSSLEEATTILPNEELFVIGGGEIYKQAFSMADKLYLTVVCKDYDADTYFPEIDFSQWNEIERKEGTEPFDVPFSFITYAKIQ